MSARTYVMMLALAAGCGDDGNSTPADAAADGPAPTVTATATSVGCFAASTFDRIALHRADGTTAGPTLALPPAGVTLAIEPGDLLTAADRNHDLQTVIAVEGGDAIAFGKACGPADVADEITVTWSPFAGAASYQACTRCNCAPTATLSTTPYTCDDDDPLVDDIGVVAYNDGFDPIAFSWLPAAAITGGTVTAAPWQPATSLAITVDALPPGPRAPFRSRIRLGDTVTANREDELTVLPATVTRRAAPTGAFPVQISTAAGRDRLVAAIPTGTAAFTFAVSDSLPAATGFTFDPATRRFAFSLDGVAPYDAAVVEIVWPLPDALALTWRVLVPPGVTSFTLPRHPDLPDTARPSQGQPSVVRVSIVERADLADYAAARAVPLRFYEGAEHQLDGGAVGPVRWSGFEVRP